MSPPPIYTMTTTNIESTIQKYLPIRREKKDLHGEVFTPLFLINNMLDKIPAHVWRDPGLTWLDPAAGIGSFFMCVYHRLMLQLPDKYKGVKGGYTNVRGKRQYILRHMLFMVEIDATNVRDAKHIFGKDAHICCADYLEGQQQWVQSFGGIAQFDVILGNPPFNAPQVHSGKKGGGESLWPDFVRTSLDSLTSQGYLLFIHPSTWRKPRTDGAKTDDLFDMMTHTHQMEYLEIHSKSDGVRTFGIETRYDWYLVKKRPASKKTTVKDELGEIHRLDLRKWTFLPNSHYSKILQLLGHSDNVIYSRTQFGTDKSWTHATQTATFKYPLIHSTPQSGVRYYWTSTKTPDVDPKIPMFGVPKIVFGESGTSIQQVVVDMSGKYGLTQEAIGLRIRSIKEGRQLEEALLSDAFREILQAMSFSQYRIDWRIFVHLKPTFFTHFITRKSEKSNKRKTENLRRTRRRRHKFN